MPGSKWWIPTAPSTSHNNSLIRLLTCLRQSLAKRPHHHHHHHHHHHSVPVKLSTPVYSVDCWLPAQTAGLCPVQWGKKQDVLTWRWTFCAHLRRRPSRWQGELCSEVCSGVRVIDNNSNSSSSSKRCCTIDREKIFRQMAANFFSGGDKVCSKS